MNISLISIVQVPPEPSHAACIELINIESLDSGALSGQRGSGIVPGPFVSCLWPHLTPLLAWQTWQVAEEKSISNAGQLLGRTGGLKPEHSLRVRTHCLGRTMKNQFYQSMGDPENKGFKRQVQKEGVRAVVNEQAFEGQFDVYQHCFAFAGPGLS